MGFSEDDGGGPWENVRDGMIVDAAGEAREVGCSSIVGCWGC